jgi:hypothetical protein
MNLDLPHKFRPQPSARSLNTWVRDAVRLTGMRDRRVGWILASTTVLAALQRALGADGKPLFLAKGGVYLEMHLGLGARVTQDIDTLFRGSVDDFMTTLADVMALGGDRSPCKPLKLRSSPGRENWSSHAASRSNSSSKARYGEK